MEFARAESLKREVLAGTAESAVDSPEHMAVRIAADEFVRRVGGEMSRSLASFCPEGGGDRPGILHLTGDGARIPELAVGLGERLQMRVERWEAPGHLRLGVAIAEASGAAETAPLSDLIGLAEGAAKREAAKVNLLPCVLRWEMRIRRWWPWMAVTTLLIIAGLAVAVWRARTQADEIRGKTAEIKARINELRRLDEHNRDNLARLAQANQRIAALQRLIEARSGWVAFFADLQERLVKTEDVWLESLQILPPGKPPTSPASAPGNSGSSIIAPADHATRPGPDPVVRLALAGYLFDAGKPLAAAGEGSCEQARCLLAQLRASPYVAAIETERFDSSRPELLRFEVTLVLAPRTLF
jgi:type IV pilus assembly protein PilM